MVKKISKIVGVLMICIVLGITGVKAATTTDTTSKGQAVSATENTPVPISNATTEENTTPVDNNKGLRTHCGGTSNRISLYWSWYCRSYCSF